jgi:hypothetical protein
MSWVNDLVAGFGLPSGAATIATGMYAACVAAQKAARPEAIKDIGHFLKEPAWTLSVRPSEIAHRLFNEIFGEQQISFKCCGRSVLASALFIGSIILTLYLEGVEVDYVFNWSFWIYLPFVGFLADYIALWKTRILLKFKVVTVFLVIADVVASMAISTIVFYFTAAVTEVISVYLSVGTINLKYAKIFALEADAIKNNWRSIIQGDFNHFFPPVMFVSTLLTSIWTTSIVLSSVIIKLLVPIQRGTTWFFDVEKRPIEAIGIVAGALIIIGSVVWSLARSIF